MPKLLPITREIGLIERNRTLMRAKMAGMGYDKPCEKFPEMLGMSYAYFHRKSKDMSFSFPEMALIMRKLAYTDAERAEVTKL